MKRKTLPNKPWQTLADVDMGRDEPRRQRRWLAAQAALAVALQTVVAWPW
jgi:hypothetical protein